MFGLLDGGVRMAFDRQEGFSGCGIERFGTVLKKNREQRIPRRVMHAIF